MSDHIQEIDAFITRWANSGAAERSNYALFISELCDILGVNRPDPSVENNAQNAYVIDRSFTHSDKSGKTSTVYLDLYKRGHFVLETKQGSSGEGDKKGHGKRGTAHWDKALDKAYGQAKDYILDIPADEGRPPFLIVCDVGYLFDIYAEFSGTGGTYLRFPDPKNHRIKLEDLRDADTRELLRKIWTDPHSLDPSKYAAKVTREVADTLAKLAASLEKNQHDPQIVATFLQRLLFTLFAEDVGLLPLKSFEKLLEQAVKTPKGFTTLITQLWKEMAEGASFSTVIMQEVAHFNGGLFENPTALPLDKEQIELLLHAAKQDWKEVEPAIFGTLLERALDPRERHKLGAHYTPRSYVERLIEPALMQPLRDQWNAVKTSAAIHDEEGKKDKALKELETFHHHLTHIKVLDPACGSGNFLYVALARIKELEAEVLDLFESLGGNRMFEMDTTKVRPSQFLGIEINANAAAIAQLVLWIGYFQWHHKTTGTADTNDRPLLENNLTIENRDAVLEYDERIPRIDADTGEVITIWNGVTTKPHPVTGKEVPDETARKPLFDFINPRRTQWPQADYIIGNPPFIGGMKKRELLGDGYAEALDTAWEKVKVKGKTDFVMYWWHQAAELIIGKNLKASGFITTNSISQLVNRRITEPFITNTKKPLSINYAIPDHPWVDSSDGADVRVAMTVFTSGWHEGSLAQVNSEEKLGDGEYLITLCTKKGRIHADLKIGADLTSTKKLESNTGIANAGSKLYGNGFIIESAQESEFETNAREFGIIKEYMNGRDLNQTPRDVLIIDPYGLDAEELQEQFPKIYQHLWNYVKPSRDSNRNKSVRDNWWIHGIPKKELRESLSSLNRYISTTETSKHRFFTFLNTSILPDNKLINVASSVSSDLATLSSYIHTCYASLLGSRLGVGNDLVYVKTTCFETFPFPDLDDKPELKARLDALGEQLDSHRKARQAEHPDLTLTGMYNVIEKLRKEESLTEKEKVIHDQGLVTLLMQIHDEIDQATYEAYGWQDIWQWHEDCKKGKCYDPENSSITKLEVGADFDFYDNYQTYTEKYDQVLLQRLVDLNHLRAAEEAKGKIRYLRPEYQDPEGTQKAQPQELNLPASEVAATKVKTTKLKWPKELPKQVEVILPLIPELGKDHEELSLLFGRKSKKREQEIAQIISMLESLGQLNVK